jgi:stearoyl-CoA desaturase (delta-9 desaturase)
MTQDPGSNLEQSTDGPVTSDIVYPSAVPFVIVHAACFAAIWTGVTVEALAIGVSLYWLRIFAIGAGYHRYFSHRAYETSRVFQFILAAMAQTTAQKSVLWWAANHRDHHLHSDTELDVHSPRHFGFVYSHLGWIFAIGAGYHRYFSHRAYETSRVFQFVLAAMAQTTAQKSVLWWAANHRDHHLHSDTEFDVHSPRHFGFVYSHLGWIFARRHETTNFARVADLAQYPELMWLHRHELAPPFALALACFAAAGWPGLIVGFFWSTVAVYHATFSINSLAHVVGRRRYVTGDDSRNNWLLAIFTMGEGWHNNHHAFQSSVRQGFRWWEYDPTFYFLRLLERLGLVWKLKYPTLEVVQNQHRLGSRVTRRAASQVAESFNAERIAAAVAAALGNGGLADLRARLCQVQPFAAMEVLGELNLPHIPSKAEIVRRARALLANSPSMDDIAAKAHELLLEAIGTRLATLAAQTAN